MEGRASVINNIERIMTKAYLQEIHSYGDIVKKILKSKKPKVIYFYRQKNTEFIIMDRVKLKPILNRKLEIIRFDHPTWDSKDSKKINIRDIN